MLARRLWTWPFTLVFGAVLHIRHALYDTYILRRTRPAPPTIAIGNLALGGTGKTPMLELVLRVLADVRPVAALSRGHGRSTTDIHEVMASDTASISGDEPVQVKRHFPDARVFVGRDRVRAVARIVREVPDVRAVVLDDALQHRALDPGLRILLTTWQNPYADDALFPMGRLRDLRSRARYVDVVIVTKCPKNKGIGAPLAWRERLRLQDDQALFFSTIDHLAPQWSHGGSGAVPTGGGVSALLFTGIADPTPLLAHARTLWGRVDHAAFTDHHRFTIGDGQGLARHFSTFAPGPKLLVTTEKDMARMGPVADGDPLSGLPIVVIGMRTVILYEPERFAALIRDHVATHPAHR